MISIVYEIIHIKTNECIYVGSSKSKYRFTDHKKPSSLTRGHGILYKYINENGGWDNYIFNIINTYDSISKIDLLNAEKAQILAKSPICNSKSPITTADERKEQRRIQAIEWRKNNPGQSKIISVKASQQPVAILRVKERCSTQIICECGGKYTLQNKTNHLKTRMHNR